MKHKTNDENSNFGILWKETKWHVFNKKRVKFKIEAFGKIFYFDKHGFQNTEQNTKTFLTPEHRTEHEKNRLWNPEQNRTHKKKSQN